jgi:hypothetical protein
VLFGVKVKVNRTNILPVNGEIIPNQRMSCRARGKQEKKYSTNDFVKGTVGVVVGVAKEIALGGWRGGSSRAAFLLMIWRSFCSARCLIRQML